MAKGGSYERVICKQLSLWWSYGKEDHIFWRTANSGGRATVRAMKGKRTKGAEGDIGAVDPSGLPLLQLLTIEVKRGYNHTSIAHSLDKPPRLKLTEWEKQWLQSEAQAKAAMVPYHWLITKRDGKEPLLFMPTELWGMLLKQNPGIRGEETARFRDLPFRVAPSVTIQQSISLVRLDSFLESCTPRTLKLVLKEYQS